jgi:hypothetical protein
VLEDARLPLVHNVESTEVIDLMPYLGPEFIAAILKRENTAAVDLWADSESATEKFGASTALPIGCQWTSAIVIVPRQTFLIAAHLRAQRRVCISRLEPRKGKHHVFDIP